MDGRSDHGGRYGLGRGARWVVGVEVLLLGCGAAEGVRPARQQLDRLLSRVHVHEWSGHEGGASRGQYAGRGRVCLGDGAGGLAQGRARTNDGFRLPGEGHCHRHRPAESHDDV